MTVYNFRGSVEINDTDACSRGCIDIWLLNAIQNIIEEGPETDDIYENLKLQWKHSDEEAYW